MEAQVDQVSALRNAIRDIPDFPKKGIIFKDITPLLNRGDLLHTAVDLIAGHYRGAGIDKIVVIESRGFIIGTPVAYALGIGVVPVRKKGKLPYKTVFSTYQLEYGFDTLEMHEDAVVKGERVLIIDDLLATGGTAAAAAELLKKSGAIVNGIGFLVELSFLRGRERLKDYDVFSVITY
jgi:adenine phosphoribosyltransferase